MSYWFPERALKTGHFPVWCWLFPPLWLVLVPIYGIWLVGLAGLFLVSIPVNIVRLATHHNDPAAPRYDVYTGKRLR